MGWSRRKGSDHEIHPFSTRRDQPSFLLAAWRPLSGPYRLRKTDNRSSSPELITHHTSEARLAAIDRHLIEWWQKQRNFRADPWREARSSLRALPPGPRTAIMRYWQKAFLPGDATYLLGLIRDYKVRKRCFWHALVELRRLKLISEGRRHACPTLGTLMIKIDILCYMSQSFAIANEFRPETKTRPLPTIDAKSER
jgi:hypothetical protein